MPRATGWSAARTGGGASARGALASARAIRASPMSRIRFFGSRSRQRRSRARTLAGVSGGSASQAIGSRTTEASTSVTVSPRKRPFPVSISESTTPNDQMSARLSTACPRACSGAM